jgi:23S rRNA (pseudouridine1915-N3)-methyltransferase
MKLRVLWVGKTKNPELARLCTDYIGRIKHFLPLEIVEVKDDRKLAAALESADRVVALDPAGKAWTSHQLAAFVQKHMNEDPRPLTFVVGDFAGLPDAARKRADVQWSLSPLTFTHDLTRVILLEQLYRAFTIMRNIPYPK